LELDVGDDERRGLAVGAGAAARDGEAVDRALAARVVPRRVGAAAVRAEEARVPDRHAAVVAALEQEAAFGGGVPELLGVEVRAGRRGRQGGHASSCPRMRVALPMRVARLPPVPWARTIWQSGTWTAG